MKKELTSIKKEKLIKDFFTLPFTEYSKEEVVSHFTDQGSYFTLGYKHLIVNYDYIRSLFNLYTMIPLDLNNYTFFAYCLLAGVDNPVCSCGKLKWRDTRKIGKTCGDTECTFDYKKSVIDQSNYFSLPHLPKTKNEILEFLSTQHKNCFNINNHNLLIEGRDYIVSLYDLYNITKDLSHLSLLISGILSGKDSLYCSCGSLKEKTTNGVRSTCKTCTPIISQYEGKLYDIYSKSFKVERNRYILEGKQLDLYFPDYKLGIEFNGDYWHSDKYVSEKYHQEKVAQFNSIGTQVINIFQHQFTPEKEGIWNSLIRSKLNSLEFRLYARKCQVREVSYHDSREFLIKNHLQGDCASSIQLGLYYLDELVSLMTFGRPRFSQDVEFELLRFCSKINYSVIGGASKLLKNFIKLNSPKSIISYANLQWSNGNLYQNLGFTLKSISSPNYWWVKNKKVLTRYQCQRSKLPKLLGNSFDENLSERENMQNNGFYKVNDCGSLVFILNLDQKIHTDEDTITSKKLFSDLSQTKLIRKTKSWGSLVVKSVVEKKIICFETKEVFSSVLEAVEAKSADESSLYRALDKPNKTSGGFHWCTDLSNFDGVGLGTKSGPKRVYCVENQIWFESLSKASKDLCIAKVSILRCLDQPNKTAGDYHWCTDPSTFIPEGTQQKVCKKVFCYETGEEFESISLAAEFAGVKYSSLRKVIDLKNRTAGGYHWESVQ